MNRYLNKQKYVLNLFFYLLETWNFIELQKAFYKIWGLLNPSQVILNMLSVLNVELAKELVYCHYALCLRNLSSSKLLHPHTGSTDNILVFQSSQIKHSRLTSPLRKLPLGHLYLLQSGLRLPTSIALASISSATSGGPNLIWTVRITD